MKKILIIICLSLSACGSAFNPFYSGSDSDSNEEEGENQQPMNNEDATGQDLYQVNCALCHGDDAKGNAIWPSTIQSYEPIKSIVLDGRGTMQPVAINETQTQKIQDFLLTLGEPTEDLDGEGLYNRFCASCHGADALGADIWPASIQSYEPIESIVIDGRGTMAAITLETTQVADIQAYLLTLGTPPEDLDGEGLYDRFCGNCHGVDALGTDIWPASIQAYDPIDDIVKNGRGTMGMIPIKQAYIDDIQTYLNGLAPPLSELNGRQVYERLCVGCHGDSGKGTARGMQLRYEDYPYSDYWTRRGRTKTAGFTSDMPAYPEAMISATQLRELFDYVDANPHPTSGSALYLQYCGNCHGANAAGGSSKRSIRGSDDNFTEVIRNGKEGTAYRRRTSYMTGWSSAILTSSDIQKIMSYTRQL